MHLIDNWASRARAALAGLTVAAASCFLSVPGRAESGFPLGALTPLVGIGQAIENAGLDLALNTGPFDPQAPEPIAVAPIPPSLVEGPITTPEREEAQKESQTPRLALPEMDKPVPGVTPRRKPPVPVQTAEPSAAPPSASESRPSASALSNIAATYRRFQSDIHSVSRMRLDQPANLNKAVDLFMAYDGKGLSRGWVAAEAEIAAASKPFQSGVESMNSKRGGAKRFFGDLQTKPNQIHGIKGADKAQTDILNAVALDVAMMRLLAARFLEVAYERNGDEERQATQANNGGLTPAALQSQGKMPVVPARSGSRGWPVMTQMLTVGLHLNLNGEADVPPADETKLTTNAHAAQCMRWAMLNLEQCIAAARLNTEKAFCVSRHALEERADCLATLLQ